MRWDAIRTSGICILYTQLLNRIHNEWLYQSYTFFLWLPEISNKFTIFYFLQINRMNKNFVVDFCIYSKTFCQQFRAYIVYFLIHNNTIKLWKYTFYLFIFSSSFYILFQNKKKRVFLKRKPTNFVIYLVRAMIFAYTVYIEEKRSSTGSKKTLT